MLSMPLLVTWLALAPPPDAPSPAPQASEPRNWYLSNIGLPGFWPHAELYSLPGHEGRAHRPGGRGRLFDSEYDPPDRQLDFVAFLDGREQERDAALGDVEWDIAQQ